ncbi:MAG: branched-chain amino acid transaminase [Candidatus Methanofastidiosia archaeon]
MEVELPRYAFLDDEFVKWENAKVHISTHALHYGTAVFAGLRGYWNKKEKQIYIFRVEDHFKRFHHSCKIMLIELKYSIDELKETTRELVVKNRFQKDIYIRPLAFKKKGPKVIGMDITTVSDSLLMFALGFGEYLPLGGGLRVCTSTWKRIDDLSIPARAKISGSYVNSTLAKAEATLNGFDDAIFLTREGYVSEGSAMNLFIVRDGELITTPVYADILEGITRKSIIELARDLGYKVKIRPIQRSELYIMDEAFFCGTGVQIAPIASVDHRKIESEEMPISRHIQKEFFKIVRGENSSYKKWLFPAYK